MSARTRQAPFPGVGGHFFRGCRAQVAEGAGVRHAGGGLHLEPRYRQFSQLTRSQVIKVEFFSAIMWFWIFWRFWPDSDAVLGHSPYPDPSQWTDEELGILPDDED
ncbi:NADH dehydrogenase [ubiquinone] 1 beta subcomplex subunit 2, mitochondrial-like [Physeter macrocephalus]|uniref:NADH dehydrogenase [ubiquinone] 1 beta subcomplex subunit 2, mitochondrial n=1 Tax=Physeter macrocephalus TaxID=9755 RepID=A0A9W2W6Z2_PHYMC|nr:NADH dehydrogenase [ubiquinone] 1 beta subcomplex subunit 2, mitochondrial-like [Physeter catodon]